MSFIRHLIPGIAALLGMIAAAAGATAPGQSGETGANPSDASYAPGTPTAFEPGPDSDETKAYWKRNTLFGDLDDVRPSLARYGIKIVPVYTGEVMGNLLAGAGGDATRSQPGGVGHGVIYDHVLNLPLDVDFSKPFPNWKGASFHASALWIAGPGLSRSYVGDLGDVSNIDGYNTVRLQELWFQQTFWDGKASFRGGELAADAEFALSSNSSIFSNGTFGVPNLIAANLGDPFLFPSYPVTAPGARLYVQPVPEFYLQTGVYDGNAEAQAANPHGTAFPINAGSGALVMTEAAYLLNQEKDSPGLHGTYKLGAFVHTRDFASWQSQTAGAPPTAGADYGIYAIADQQLYAKDGQDCSCFCCVGHAPSDVNVIEWYASGGFDFTGFVPGRSADVIGLAVARSKFSGNYSDFQQAANGTNPYDAETVLEATYVVQLRPWWTLQPDFQYLFTPGGVEGTRDAAVLGLRTSVTF